MKKIFSTILLVALCAFTQLNAATNDDPGSHVRRGFYFSIGTGLIFTSLDQEYNDKMSEGVETTTSSYSGLFSYDELRLGASIANLVSIYATCGFGYNNGSMPSSYEEEVEPVNKDKPKSRFEESDNVDFRLLFGIGGEFYPIQNKASSLYGLFVGLSLGEMVDIVIYTDHDYDKIYKDETDSRGFASLFFRVEAGKEWWFSRNWSFGVALSFAYGSSDGEVDDDDSSKYVDTESDSGVTVGLMVRLTH